jgi:hypothetical protein
LRRELGDERLQKALRQIEKAQNLLADALADLSTIMGGAAVWTQGGKVHEQVRGYWHQVAFLRRRLAVRGGVRVDDVTLEAELGRRNAQNSAN